MRIKKPLIAQLVIGSMLFTFSQLLVALSLPAPKPGWKSLFNGTDLQGWEVYVSYQPETNQFNLKSKHTPRAVGQDPLKVFSVVDGALRVSGEEWGGITTRAEYESFHLMLEVKWGEKKWPPRENAKRDSGILYFAVGPHGAQSDHWMRSHEFQIQEGDFGDYHSLDGVTVDAHVSDANEGDWKFYRYDPQQPMTRRIATRILKRGDYEKPLGEWNTLEILADGKTLIHKVNGQEVLRAFHSEQQENGKNSPLVRGKIQIQSEGAEVFFRNIRIRQLSKPAEHY
jgi:hypothetical protein